MLGSGSKSSQKHLIPMRVSEVYTNISGCFICPSSPIPGSAAGSLFSWLKLRSISVVGFKRYRRAPLVPRHTAKSAHPPLANRQAAARSDLATSFLQNTQRGARKCAAIIPPTLATKHIRRQTKRFHLHSTVNGHVPCAVMWE